jgi:hypothetical protein
MRAGFGRQDITPRVGVELCGFGPFLNRPSIAVRDRLWARAIALADGDATIVLVSCDLIGVHAPVTARVRALVHDATGVPPESVMVHCTHTHSGPSVDPIIGWGAIDTPYVEVLPARLAAACIEAVANLQPAVLSHAEVPCEGIGLNREYDRDAPPLEDVLREDWRPARPELTDTTCHVLRVDAGERLLGFASYFGCHPVVCCETTRYIHGDFVGVATNMLEREHLGATGLFLQGAQGDVNSCVVHKAEPEALPALDVIASRYARRVREGLRHAAPLGPVRLGAASRRVRFPRIALTADELRGRLAEQEAILHAPGASDADYAARMAAVNASALRGVLPRVEAGLPLDAEIELQGMRIGPLALLGTPFEVFQAIKRDVVAKTTGSTPLVMGLTNSSEGYAPDHTAAERGGYAAQVVPLIKGNLPYAPLHDPLVRELVALHGDLMRERPA